MQLTDYHEFGFTMQGRNYTADNYRFGYQGSEKETGVSGMYTTDYRALDVRLGKWFMPDPLTHEWQSPYCSMNNNPIAIIDPLGLDGEGVGGQSGAPTDNGGPITTTTEGCAYEDNGPHIGLPNNGDMLSGSFFAEFVVAYDQTKIPSIPKVAYDELEEVDVSSDYQKSDGTTIINAGINLVNGGIALQNAVLHPMESVQIEMQQTVSGAYGTAKFVCKAGDYIGRHTLEEMVKNFFKAQAEWLLSSWSPASNETRETVVMMIFTLPATEFGGTGAVMEEISAEVELGGTPLFEVVTEETTVSTGGRLGGEATRSQLREIATELESRGYEITGGGGRRPEEYLKPLSKGRKGGSYPDITAVKDGKTLRINTVDTYKNGTITNRELRNALRIRQQMPEDHLLLIAKPR